MSSASTPKDLDKETEALLAVELALIQAEEDRLTAELLASERLAQRLQDGYESDMDSELEHGGKRPMLDRPSPFSSSENVGGSRSGSHHRVNHRGGVRERERKERRAARADGAETLSTPGTPNLDHESEKHDNMKFEAEEELRTKQDMQAKAEVEEFANRELDLQHLETQKAQKDIKLEEFPLENEKQHVELPNELDSQNTEIMKEQEAKNAKELKSREEAAMKEEEAKKLELQKQAEQLKARETEEAAARAQSEKEEQELIKAQYEREKKDREVQAAKEMEKAMEQMNAMNLMITQQNEGNKQTIKQNEEEVGEDKAPSLTYDSDADEDEHEALEEAAALVQQEAEVEVRRLSRADTGSFQEKVEAEMGVVEHVTTEMANNKELPTVISREPSSESYEENASSSSQRAKHEIKLLGLKRPLPAGGNVPINAHANKHEVKITGLQRPIAR